MNYVGIEDVNDVTAAHSFSRTYAFDVGIILCSLLCVLLRASVFARCFPGSTAVARLKRRKVGSFTFVSPPCRFQRTSSVNGLPGAGVVHTDGIVSAHCGTLHSIPSCTFSGRNALDDISGPAAFDDSQVGHTATPLPPSTEKGHTCAKKCGPGDVFYPSHDLAHSDCILLSGARATVGKGRDVCLATASRDSGAVAHLGAHEKTNIVEKAATSWHLLTPHLSNIFAVAGVNWLSTISNCLTDHLSGSQVVYSFLLSTCDVVLYVLSSQVDCRSGCTEVIDRICSPSVACVDAAETISFHGDGKRKGSIASIDAIPDVTSVRLPSQEGRDVVAGEEPLCNRADGGKGGLFIGNVNTHALRAFLCGCVGGLVKTCSALLAVCTLDSGVSSRQKYRGWRQVLVSLEWRRFLLLAHVGLFLLVVFFYKHHLFFTLGALAGYAACWGTLWLLVCEVRTLLLLLRSMNRMRGTFELYSLLSSQVVAGSAGRPYKTCASTLPPSDVWESSHLAVSYLLQHTFSFLCSIIYFLMLLEEGDVLYSTHVNFMRWYMNTFCQALVDVGRISVFLIVAKMFYGRGRSCFYGREDVLV
ncbi:hypothetical protein ERJ75_001335500 [Trypanosoma vivax]|uniref:Transmembrane protein n=1 Tax=Trypanosoma vivax (strain Y486) TaxID=1055687 RepID=G0U639_TRYVY|nr:hypothetical protein ERJ75_001335500 [Trypanosoma vivax]CCC51341.1 conserved hypothetical protein [Trypanosoma vivax Y486]